MSGRKLIGAEFVVGMTESVNAIGKNRQRNG